MIMQHTQTHKVHHVLRCAHTGNRCEKHKVTGFFRNTNIKGELKTKQKQIQTQKKTSVNVCGLAREF